MDLPALSDEERRVLLEYRITRVPSRRPDNDQTKQSKQQQQQQQQQQQKESQSQQSCSSASSLTSTSSSSNNGSVCAEKKCQNNQSVGELAQQQLQTGSQPFKTTDQDKQLPLQKSKSHSPQQHAQHQANNRNNHQHHHHSHKHHGHHHHHHHTHRKHKSTTLMPELTTDQLTKMLELASGLSYLKLVSPMRSTNGSQTADAAAKQQPLDRQNCNKNLPDEDINELRTNNENNNSTKHRTFSQGLSIHCDHNLLGSSNGSHAVVDRQSMFEKVDYIKKISNRRKALKQLKKFKNKSCSISLPTIGSAKPLAES